MPEPLTVPWTLALVALSLVGGAHQRASEQQAAKRAAESISGFVGFYRGHEVAFRTNTFPPLANQPRPLPHCVYRLVPARFLHDVVAAKVTLPDDTMGELVPLSRLSKLTALSVTWARYADAELKHFGAFHRLEYLELSHSDNLTDKGLLRLAVLKNLKVLKISGDRITETGVAKLRRKMPHCTINGRRTPGVAFDGERTERSAVVGIQSP